MDPASYRNASQTEVWDQYTIQRLWMSTKGLELDLKRRDCG